MQLSKDITIENTTYFILYEIDHKGLQITYMDESIGDSETREIKPTEAIFDIVKKQAELELSEDIESEKLDDFEQELDYRETYSEKGKSNF
jgi:hypothetical protein